MFSLLLRSSKDFVVLEGIQLLLLLLDFPNLFQKRPVIFEINLAGRVFLVRQLGGFRIFFGGKKPAIPREGDIRTTLSPGGPKAGNPLRVLGSTLSAIFSCLLPLPRVEVADEGVPTLAFGSSISIVLLRPRFFSVKLLKSVWSASTGILRNAAPWFCAVLSSHQSASFEDPRNWRLTRV
jgi:hypothetical protein